nr:MAG TPA: hypothetical protein [Caudoviricetes sp.]
MRMNLFLDENRVIHFDVGFIRNEAKVLSRELLEESTEQTILPFKVYWVITINIIGHYFNYVHRRNLIKLIAYTDILNLFSKAIQFVDNIFFRSHIWNLIFTSFDGDCGTKAAARKRLRNSLHTSQPNLQRPVQMPLQRPFQLVEQGQ